MIGGMVSSMLSGSLYAELQQSVSSLQASDQLRKETEEMCSALIDIHHSYQQELNAIFSAFFIQKREEVQSSFDLISAALISGDSIHSGLEKLAQSLGKGLQFSDPDSFTQHLRSGSTLVI